MPRPPKRMNQPSAEELALAEYVKRQRRKERDEKLRSFARNPVGYMREFMPDTITYPKIEETMMSVVDNPVTGVMSANGVGKTHLGAHVIKWFLDCYSPMGTCEIYTTAAPPAANLRRMWSEFESIKTKYPNLFSTEILASRHKVGDKNFVEAVPIPESASPEKRKESFAGKHAHYMLFVLDEANRIPEEIYGVIREAMGAGIIVRLLFFFNPRSRSGPAYKRIVTGQCNAIYISAFDHPNVIEGWNKIPGAVTRAGVVNEIVRPEGTRPLHPDETFDEEDCFIVPDFLVGERGVLDNGDESEPLQAGARKIIDPTFTYRILGRAPKIGAMQLIPPDWIAQARTNYELYVAANGDVPPKGIEPVAGFDIAETTDLNVYMVRWGGYIKFADSWTGVDLVETANRGIDLHQKWRVRVTNVDGNGLGAGIAPNMVVGGCAAEGIKVQESPIGDEINMTDEGISFRIEFKILRDQMLWAVREWLRPGNGAMLPDNERLISALNLLTYYEEEKSLKVRVIDAKELKAQLGHSPDELMALALSLCPQSSGTVSMVRSNPNNAGSRYNANTGGSRYVPRGV